MLSEARRYAAAAKKERADRYSANVPVIREIQESGAPSRLADDGPSHHTRHTAPQRDSSAELGHGYARVTFSRVIWLMFSAPTCRMIVVNSSSRISSTRSTPGSPNEARPHT